MYDLIDRQAAIDALRDYANDDITSTEKQETADRYRFEPSAFEKEALEAEVEDD